MIDLSTWETIVEDRIRTAQDEGQFDRLPGFGKPLPEVDLSDPNWWVKRKLKAERLSVLPPLLEVKLQRERLLEQLAQIGSEAVVRNRVTRLNEKIRAVVRGPQPECPVDLPEIDVEVAVRCWHERRTSQ